MVFDTYAELKQNLDREDLDVTADTVLVLRNAGPLGGPRMPEWGMLLVLVKPAISSRWMWRSAQADEG